MGFRRDSGSVHREGRRVVAGVQKQAKRFILLAGKIETFSIECARSKRLISDRVRFRLIASTCVNALRQRVN